MKKCPKCGSKNLVVEYPPGSNICFAKPNRYKCKKCHYTDKEFPEE